MKIKTIRKSIFIGIIIVILSCISILVFIRYNKLNTHNSMLKTFSQITGNEIILGNEDAHYSVIVYFDYNCSFCKKFFNKTYPALNEKYIKTGKVKLILKLVCSNTDTNALAAYQTAICVNKFGDYSKLHKLLMHKSEIIYTEHFSKLVDEIIYSNVDIAECILDSNYNPVKENNYQLEELKTNGTPTFVINNNVIAGYKDFFTIEKILTNEYSLNKYNSDE